MLHWRVLAALQYFGLTSGNESVDKTKKELLRSQGGKKINTKKIKIGGTTQVRTGPENLQQDWQQLCST